MKKHLPATPMPWRAQQKMKAISCKTEAASRAAFVNFCWKLLTENRRLSYNTHALVGTTKYESISRW
jgi:hypothetical protein